MSNYHEWQQRVVDEHTALFEKHDRLGKFINGQDAASRARSPKTYSAFDLLSAQDQELLRAQYAIMSAYLRVLHVRISRFGV